MVPEVLAWAFLRLDERLAVHGAALALEPLGWGVRPLLRWELVEEPGQPPHWSRVLLAWLPLLVLAGPASQLPVLAQLGKAMALLILLQIPLMLVEASWGLPMSFGPPAAQLAQASVGLPTRLVGTFILPNILGVAVVCLLGFCMAYLPQRRALMPLAIAALPMPCGPVRSHPWAARPPSMASRSADVKLS